MNMLHFGPNIYTFHKNLALAFLKGFSCLFVCFEISITFFPFYSIAELLGSLFL